jgi:CelD/BcsL family acetyltransferase involved in cellulose biosynthesis
VNAVTSGREFAEAISDWSEQARVREIDFQHLSPQDEERWTQLAEQSGKSSIFALPWFVSAVLKHCEAQGQFKLFCVEYGNGDWMGTIALEQSQRFGRLRLATWQNLKNPNQFLGTPLVKRGSEARFWQILLKHLDERSSGGFGLRCTELPTDDEIVIGLLETCKEENRHVEVTRRFERAILYSKRAALSVTTKRDKRLAALERQLERDYGTITVTCQRDQRLLHPWIEAFLALELRSWKGKEGSAMASCAANEALFRTVLHAAAEAGYLHGTTLMAGDRIVAMSVQFINGTYGFGFKTTYDETLARYAPGLILLRHITQDLRAGPPVLFDSCSDPRQVSINSFWRDRREVTDVMISLAGRHRLTKFKTVFALLKTWHWAKSWSRRPKAPIVKNSV